MASCAAAGVGTVRQGEEASEDVFFTPTKEQRVEEAEEVEGVESHPIASPLLTTPAANGQAGAKK